MYEAIGNDFPVLGIPAGVKIHSAVYGITPYSAGNLQQNSCAADVSACGRRSARSG
jgi:predicted polyphosphate/ATP-dependent NAD kinase